MSCEGNRLKFFEQLQAMFRLDAAELEKIYQAGKAACAMPSEKELERITQKTRLLFQDMQAAGLKPPTHSADGLPKIAARAGYAAVFDHLRRSVIAPVVDLREYDLDKNKLDAWPLPIKLGSLLDEENKNNAGVFEHRYVQRRQGGEAHIWFGTPPLEKEEDFLGRSIDRLYKINPNDERMKAFVAAVDADGFLADGYAPQGFDRDGFDSFGYNLYGLTREEMTDPEKIREAAVSKHMLYYLRRGRISSRSYQADVEGFDSDGFRPYGLDEEQDCDRFGFNRLGLNQKSGRSWTGYDENGLDASGKPAPQRAGYDAWGYERKTGLTAPDAQGRRYNLIGWVYDAAADECYDPQNPTRRMKHSGSFGYSAKRRKVVLKHSYVPTQQEMEERLRNPTIRWNEYRRGGGQLLSYACLEWNARMAAYKLNLPQVRYLRSKQYLNDDPDAEFLGVSLRCPKCGQFTGAAPHLCPHYGSRKVLALKNGLVIAFEREAWKPVDYYLSGRRKLLGYEKTRFPDVYDDLLEVWKTMKWEFVTDSAAQTGEYTFYGLGVAKQLDTLADFFWQRGEEETAIVLEAPHSPLGKDFNADYYGGVLPGHHWRSGLNLEGYDPYGFHFLSGATKQGVTRNGIKALSRLKMMLQEADSLLEQKGRKAKDVLEATYSRIATAIAGAARRVTISEEGGPRPGMFWTDMRGRIQAERYPLKDTPRNTEANNLLAMKAGIYHELGHEEDTPPGIFARVMEIAHGREEVEGIPKSAAGLVAEIYNILEDGRMERVQAKRRRGVASILAADALINPRWDEKVGEEIPLAHQVMGMMLYRSLPFFRVRQEVLDAAPQRVRKLYAEVEPLVDRAMQSPEEAFLSCIEITRRLIESDEQMRQFAEKMTEKNSQGGKWVFEPSSEPSSGESGQGEPSLIISALPNSDGKAQPDRSLVIPPRGWGKQDETAGRSGGQSQQDETAGKSGGQSQQDETAGKSGGQSQQDETAGRSSGQNQQDETAGKSGGRIFVTPQMDENFFNSLPSQVNMDEVLGDLTTDLRLGINAILRSPVGKALQRPLSEVGDILLEDPSDHEQNHTVIVLSSGEDRKKILDGTVRKLRAKAQSEGRRVARRLEVLKEEVRRKARLQPVGALDRKRFKRAVAGAENVYSQTRARDITSLAVSIQLDMSGSMHSQIVNGHLAGATLALEEALQRLDAEYMVSGFGTDYGLIKSFGDERIRDEQAAAMLVNELGGTIAAPAMRLGLLGLKETHSANKLHVVMTDGSFSDNEQTAKQAEEMRRNGIVPFGIFFGRYPPDAHLNRVFGEGGWVKIEKLSDLSEVVARRIEQIYRKILATR